LALTAAASLCDEYRGSVFFVPLVAVQEREEVAEAVAATLKVKSQGERTAEEDLIEWLQGRNLLLILDNFEHLTNGALLISNMLTTCPGLTILTTSRAPLRIRAEHLLDVPPLQAPSVTEDLPANIALRFSAIALFVRRAQAVQPGFVLTDELVPDVSAICRQLDNLPLALELAAAQIRFMSPGRLLQRLDRGASSLPPGPVDAPARHQTMRDAIAWSYDLLSQPEQHLFRQMSAFVGGCTLEAAESVLGNPGQDTLAVLGALAGKSLLLVDGAKQAEPRFSMLETVREFSAYAAEVAGETETLKRRHAEYFGRLASRAYEAQRERGPSGWSPILLPDRENLRVSLQWLADTDRTSEALTLAANMTEYWIFWGYVREGCAWMSRLLERGRDDLTTGTIDRIPAHAFMGAARLAWIQNDYARAAELYKEAMDAHHREGNSRGECLALSNLGTVEHMQNNYVEASAHYVRALELARTTDDMYGMAMPLTNLGILAMQHGEYDRAASALDESLAIWRALGYDQKLAVTLGNRGNLAFRLEQYEEAATLHDEALSMKRDMGDKLAIGHSLGDLALALIELGENTRAKALLQETLSIFDDMGQKDGIAQCCEALARIAQVEDELDRAARLYGGAAAVRAEIGASHHPVDARRHEAAVGSLREAMGHERFRAYWEVGRAMSVGQLVRYASTKVRMDGGGVRSCGRPPMAGTDERGR
jgi:predicted ATPase/tetratricopeptide (TPR) repeat protein